MMFIISLPLWLAALWLLITGLVGSFSKEIEGPKAFAAIFIFASSSLMAFLAARICGWV